MNFIQAILSNSILFHAMLAGIAASFVGGIIGSYVVVKRIVFICGSIAHSVLGGIGISLWLERVHGITLLSPLQGALAAAIVSALILGWIRLYYRQREDTIIAAVWTIGMSIGILFISQTPGYNVELTNFLIGNILWVSTDDLILLSSLDVLIFLTVLCFHKRFLAICFDENEARLQGIPVNALYLLLLTLTAVSIVLLIQVVGIILVITMLTIPAALANFWTIRLSTMMVLAIFISILFSITGIAASFYLDWPSGATIALLAGIAYTVCLPFSRKNV